MKEGDFFHGVYSSKYLKNDFLMESVCNEKYVTTLKIKRKCNEKKFILFALRFCYAHGMKLNRMGGGFRERKHDARKKPLLTMEGNRLCFFHFVS